MAALTNRGIPLMPSGQGRLTDLARLMMDRREEPIDTWGEGFARLGATLLDNLTSRRLEDQARAEQAATNATLGQAMAAGRGFPEKVHPETGEVLAPARPGSFSEMARLMVDDPTLAPQAMEMQIGQMQSEAERAGEAPTVKDFYEGGEVVQKQWDPATRTWVEAGRGMRWDPSGGTGGESYQMLSPEEVAAHNQPPGTLMQRNTRTGHIGIVGGRPGSSGTSLADHYAEYQALPPGDPRRRTYEQYFENYGQRGSSSDLAALLLGDDGPAEGAPGAGGYEAPPLPPAEEAPLAGPSTAHVSDYKPVPTNPAEWARNNVYRLPDGTLMRWTGTEWIEP